MPKTVALVPFTHPDSEKPVAAGEEVTLGDEDYAAMRADGKVTASEAEVKANAQEAGAEGVYNARTTREDVASTKTEEPKAKK
jgi:hypothetical protein